MAWSIGLRQIQRSVLWPWFARLEGKLVDFELKELRVDADGVEYDGGRMRWSDADWVMYSWTQTQQKGPALNVTVSRSNQVIFAIGRWQQDGESFKTAMNTALMVTYTWNGKSELPTEPWHGLRLQASPRGCPVQCAERMLGVRRGSAR